MPLFRENKKQPDLGTLIAEIKSTTDTNRYGALFIELIGALRPAKRREPGERMLQLLEHLRQDKQLELALQQMFVYLFNTRDSQSIFTNAGILSGGTFFSEMFRQIRHRILPPLPDKRSMNYLLEKAFYKNDDYRWVRDIPDDYWIEFFRFAAGGMRQADSPLQQYLVNTLTILSYRVSYLGLEEELSQQLKSSEEVITPFIEQNRKVQTFIHLVQGGGQEALLQESAQDVIDQLNECEQIIADIRANTGRYGTSLGQSYLLLRTTQQLKRMFIVTRLLTPGNLPMHSLKNSVLLFEDVIESINKRNSISDLYRKNSAMLAYQIAEHKSASGEHLITTTREEYKALFYSAAGCGVIISFAAFLKVLLHKVHLPPFWQYFAYGLNYAIAFMVIFITGATLATKQPAMTASVLASSLDNRKGGVSLQGLALNFARVWRSQFICFAGNLLVVFPMAYLISFFWEQLTGMPLMDRAEGAKAIGDQNPVTSLALYYGGLTGVCLFISGIISGYMDNKVIYSNVNTRLKEHTGLKKLLGNNQGRVSDFLVHNLGGIMGYIALGFMLGYSTLIGQFFGIPFDTRHVTISTAYYGFGVNAFGNQLTAQTWIWTSLGIAGIGFFNFLVSFSLAFYVAVRSRNVRFSQLPYVGRLIGQYLVRYPLDFIYPPANERRAEEVFMKKPKSPDKIAAVNKGQTCSRHT